MTARRLPLPAFLPALAFLLAPALAAPASGAPGSGSARADSLIALAQRAGREGKPRLAITRYREAERAAPGRRDEIQGALAFQYAWAGDLERAGTAFDAALAADPGNYDLRMGRLLVTNWKGHHLAAWKGYAGLVMEYPERAGPLVGLAAAQNWAGRPDLARHSLAWSRKLDPRNADAARLESSIRNALRPDAGVFYDWSEDSDDYQVNGVWAEAGFSPHPQVRLVPFVNRLGIRQPLAPDVNETWLGLTVAARPATRLGFRGRLSVLADRTGGATYAPLTASTTLDWTLGDRARVSGSFERFAVVSFRTFPEKITGEVYGAAVQLRPDWLTRVDLAADMARYAPVAGFETNHRRQFRIAASRQVWAPIRLRLGASGRLLDFQKVQDNGIWTPNDFWVAAGLVEWNWGPRDGRSVSGGAEIGPAREAGGDVTFFASWHLAYSQSLGRGLGLEMSAGHSEGNVESWTGYDRSYAHAGFRIRF